MIVLWCASMLWAFPFVALAGKDKFTLAPTTSWRPTGAPSTRSPTLNPTWSSQPSSSEPPSLKPSLVSPVFVGAPALPLNPTMPTVAVVMPQLTFVMQIDSMVEEEELKADLAIFLSNYLAQGTYKDSFRFLNLSSIVEQGNNVLTISIRSGEAYFDAGSSESWPSVDVLANILATYFSYWGDQNLRDYLIEQKLPVKNVTDVIVNGEKLMNRGDLTPGSTVSPDAESETNKSSSENDQFNAYAIAGIVIGGLVVLLAIALFMHTRRRQKRSLEERNEEGVVVLKPISEGDVEDELRGQINTFPSEDSKDVDPDVITVDPSSPVPPPLEEESSPVAEEASNDPPMINLPVQIRVTQPAHAEDEYNDGGAYSSDGDIISVTESLLYRDQDKQGPLFNVRSMGTSNLAIPSNTDAQTTLTAPETPTNTPPRGASVRPAQPSEFQYDASRLDQVISQAKSTQQ